MSLPLEAVDRLFVRLTTTYGAGFTRLYAGQDVAAVKTAWAHELAGFGSKAGLMALAWALENLPEQAPNVIQFRNLARQAPAPEAPRLPEPQADPARLRAELARLQPLRDAAAGATTFNHRAWIGRVLARVDAGERVSPTVHRMALDAQAGRGLPSGEVA